MRITGTSNMDTKTVNRSFDNNVQILEKVVPLDSETTVTKHTSNGEQVHLIENSADTKSKVREAVNTMNEMLEVNHSTSRFVYHEGLERYYVTVVNKDTEEVVKEIPPKKLLDAYYEMQKMLGMIVDEKI